MNVEMLSCALRTWEGPSREESYSSVSVASLGAWCDSNLDEFEAAETSTCTQKSEDNNPQDDETDKVLIPHEECSMHSSTDNFDENRVPHTLIHPVPQSCGKTPRLPVLSRGKGGHRVMDSFASLGARDSSKSLRGCMSNEIIESQDDEHWIKVDLFVTPDSENVQLGFVILGGNTMSLYLIEKAREEQFHARNRSPVNKVVRQANRHSLSFDELEDVPLFHEELCGHETQHPMGLRRRRVGPEGKAIGFCKSVSMTTLVTAGAFEHMDSVREDAAESQSAIDGCDLSGEYSTAERFNVDGICVQHIVAKNLQSGSPSSTNEFHFNCARENSSSNQAWSFTSPKIKKGIHQSIKQKWKPVTRALSRCCTWDGCSSIESSSGWMSAPIGALKRILCCGSSLSSDDETVRY